MGKYKLEECRKAGADARAGLAQGYVRSAAGKELRMRKNQKGFTIVELLIAVAILSIVVAAVCGFILVGSRSYAAGNSDINVQQEAQLALNQMSDVLIDTTRSVTYTGFDASGAKIGTALKDAEFASAPENKSLLMINGVVEETPAAVPGGTPGKTVDPGNGNKHYHFFWSKQDETLYYAELDVQSTDVDTPTVTSAFPAFDPTDPAWVKLADHVTDFSADLTQVEEKRVVMLALTFVDGTKEYVTSNNVTIRNKVAVNDAELDPVNKKKTISVAARDSGVIIEPGEEYHFSTPKVTGENVADRSVTWSVASAESIGRGTDFTDKANGILKVADSEPAGTIDVVITTNAVGSDGNPATCIVRVNIKRATAVKLWKSADTDTKNSATRISPGCTFTISADVEGNKLGEVCSVCNSPDIDIDKQVGNAINGTVYPWVIVDASSLPGATTSWNPNNYIDIIESAPDHATFYVHPDAVTYWVDASGKKIPYSAVFQCMSLLSVTGNSEGRHYDWWVPGAITLDFWEENDDAEPYGGALKYGEQTLDEKIREGLPTDYNKYVTAIRVVDNSGKQPDRVLLHFTIGGGNNYRICPDLFDLDLNGSYTFYLQALFPISEDRYVPGQGGYADDKATIEQEYFSNLNTSKPYGYVGTKYRHGKVFYAKLDRPKLVYEYNGVRYSGKNITYDPVNLYKVGVGSGIVGEIRPVDYENIVQDNSAWTYITNSLYKGEGSNQSSWEKLYYANEDSIVDKQNIYNNQNMRYFGSNTLADGAVQIEPKGSMFMKLNNTNNLEKAKGDYHIVPGMVYQNKDPGSYEIIAWRGFDFPNLPREVRYYEFDDSTIHVKVTADFTMRLDVEDNDNGYHGDALFPLPQEMEADSYHFPNMDKTEWQKSGGQLWVNARKDGQSNFEGITFDYVKYRYIPNENAWEVQPIREWYDQWNRKKVTISYGVHKCKKGDTKWERTSRGTVKMTAVDCNLSGVLVNQTAHKMYFPLPDADDFPFQAPGAQISCPYGSYGSDGNSNLDEWLKWNANVKYTVNGNKHTITFFKRGDETEKYGTFEWQKGATEWAQVQ